MHSRYRNALGFLSLASLFGISFVAIKTGLGALPPLFFAGLRFDVAAPLLLGYAAIRHDDWLPGNRADYAGIAAGAVALIALNNGLLFLGQGYTTPAAASVMYGLNPILAPVIAVPVLGQRIGLRDAAGVGLGLVGVIVIVQPGPETFAGGAALGQLYVLCAAVAIAAGSVLLRRIGASMNSVALTGWSMAGGALLLHLASVAVGEHPAGPVTGEVVAAVLVLGLPSTALAYPIYFALIGKVGPVRTNLVAYVVPIVAAITGYLVLQQPITATTVIGFFVVLAGVALLERDVVREEVARLRA
ncbi:EamA family transporter [Halolamina litorea]|uniref:DMT family transporter n=1 Tax=Halolamina litorea TaxID=1515593 RepID=A0ABD6BUQ1_9EURY|nr:DMT family transporter [Halolamina litorea]